MNQTKLRQLNEEMEKNFQELYAPEGRILVPGDGDASARVALVGEAPGEPLWAAQAKTWTSFCPSPA